MGPETFLNFDLDPRAIQSNITLSLYNFFSLSLSFSPSLRNFSQRDRAFPFTYTHMLSEKHTHNTRAHTQGQWRIVRALIGIDR